MEVTGEREERVEGGVQVRVGEGEGEGVQGVGVKVKGGGGEGGGGGGGGGVEVRIVVTRRKGEEGGRWIIVVSSWKSTYYCTSTMRGRCSWNVKRGSYCYYVLRWFNWSSKAAATGGNLTFACCFQHCKVLLHIVWIVPSCHLEQGKEGEAIVCTPLVHTIHWNTSYL